MKIKLISFFLLLSLTTALAYVSFIAATGGFHDFLMAIPKISGGGVPIKILEEVNESKVMLTYENIYDKSVKALRSHYGIVLKGTNHTYPHVMHYNMTRGGFFSKEAADHENKVVALNEKAAFDLFGTLDAVGNEIQIDRTAYLVIGIINDNDIDNRNVFIPAACLSEYSETVMANLGLTEEYTKNELKHIGIDEMNYRFINFRLITKIIKNNAFASFEIILFGVLLLVVKKSVQLVRSRWKGFMQQHQEYYITELLKDETKLVQKFIFLIIIVLSMISIEFIVMLNLFERFLEWDSLRGAFNGIHYSSFVIEAAKIERLYFLSNVLLMSLIIIFAFFMVAVWDC